MSRDEPGRAIGRYTLHGEIARGGMATVHYGRLRGSASFARIVAIKRLHGWLSHDRSFATMLMDEARLASRIRHPNVVQTLDVIAEDDELFIVLEYVDGESLARLVAAGRDDGERVPVPIAAAIACGALRGVHAAHEAKDDRGQVLEIVHRDLSPQNILVDVNGVARVLDFGVAKARGRAQVTVAGTVKGTAAYMAPEQIHGKATRRSDVFAMGIVLWEMLVGERLFGGDSRGEVLASVLSTRVAAPSARGVALPAALEAVVLRSLQRAPEKRPATALEMATAIEASVDVASVVDVASWVSRLAGASLAQRHQEIVKLESVDARGTRRAARRARPATRRRRGARIALMTALAAGLVVSVGLVLAGARSDAEKRPRADELSAPTPVVDPAPTATASATTTAPATTTVLSARSASPDPKAPATPSRAQTPPRDCAVPFTIDRDGRKTWKRECF